MSRKVLLWQLLCTVALAAFMNAGTTTSIAQAPSGLPPSPAPAPGLPAGPLGGVVETYQVTSAANYTGSYLWIVASGQHLVMLCQKSVDAKDFSCTTKRLP